MNGKELGRTRFFQFCWMRNNGKKQSFKMFIIFFKIEFVSFEIYVTTVRVCVEKMKKTFLYKFEYLFFNFKNIYIEFFISFHLLINL